VSAPNRVGSGFRKSEVLDLALTDQVLHCSRHVFDRHVRVNPVLIEQINCLDLEPLERGLGDLIDVFRAAVKAISRSVWVEPEPEFRGDHHVFTEWSQSFPHEFLIREGAVGFCRVKEGHATFDGSANYLDSFLPVSRRAIGVVQPHTAVSNRRDFQVASSKFAFLHSSSLVSHCLSWILKAGERVR